MLKFIAYDWLYIHTQKHESLTYIEMMTWNKGKLKKKSRFVLIFEVFLRRSSSAQLEWSLLLKTWLTLSRSLKWYSILCLGNSSVKIFRPFLQLSTPLPTFLYIAIYIYKFIFIHPLINNNLETDFSYKFLYSLLDNILQMLLSF